MKIEKPNHEKIFEEILESRNEEISINYVREIENRKYVTINDIFSYVVAKEIMSYEYEPQSINECRKRND